MRIGSTVCRCPGAQNTSLTCFQADATLYRTLEKARKTYAHHAQTLWRKTSGDRASGGEYAYRVSPFLSFLNIPTGGAVSLPNMVDARGTGPGPAHWLLHGMQGQGVHDPMTLATQSTPMFDLDATPETPPLRETSSHRGRTRSKQSRRYAVNLDGSGQR